MKLENSVALVTGSNRGIGQAVVEALLRAGAAKVYAAQRTPLPTRDARVVPIRIDVTDLDSIQEAAAESGDVQILINNAGILLGQPLVGAVDPQAADQEMQTNFFGTLHMCRAFAPILKQNGGGAIVNVLSILARVSLPHIGSYAASKAASYSLTQAIRAELALQGTLVVGILPAFVETDMTSRVTTVPKLPPSAVADSIIGALRDGTEDIYPGLAGDIATKLQVDPKAVERQFAAMSEAAFSQAAMSRSGAAH
jgi:NAD(P)-dependent dehydrogenase (short-subunit alcohol dehydrogenase family)